TVITARVTNDSRRAWPKAARAGDPGDIRLGVLWFADGAPDVRVAEGRVELPLPMAPKAEADVSVPLDAVDANGHPLAPGEYQVWLGVVEEYVRWFYDEGDDVQRLSVELRP